MRLRIAHLYYDLMNLYGESGNVKVLKKALEEQEVKVTVEFVSVGDEKNFDDYDFVFIGAGTERNQKIALKDLKKSSADIKRAIADGKFFLLTGNAYEMLGKEIIDIDNFSHKGLNVFPFVSKELERRIVGNIYYRSDLVKDAIIGFENRASTNNYEGYFDASDGTKEGIKHHNLIGTYMIGPILVKNPHLLKKIVNDLLLTNGIKPKIIKRKDFQDKAYDEFVNNYIKV